jgi:hypothetical protein
MASGQRQDHWGEPDDIADPIVVSLPGGNELPEQRHPGSSDRVEPTLAEALGGSRVLEIAESLGGYLGTGCDVLSMALLLSRAAGRMGLPFNLAIYSDNPGADCLIADRIANVLPEGLQRADTIKQFRALADSGFADSEVVLIRSLHDNLFRYACEASCRDTSTGNWAPSLWLIADARSDRPALGPTLPILAAQIERSLRGFGHHYVGPGDEPNTPHRDFLRRLLLELRPRRALPCPFQEQIRADIRPDEMLVFNRVLRVFAALRVEALYSESQHVRSRDLSILIEDYKAAKSFLATLAVSPIHSTLSPYSVETGELLYDAIVANEGYQQTVPSLSHLGRKLFTRRDALQITGLSYNTVKSHLTELEGEGILESTVVPAKRERGRQIYFRFRPSSSPPFGTENPYGRLPEPDEIEGDCSRLQ